mgnify:CR=1 FL=1
MVKKYSIRTGDSFQKLAQQHKVSVEELMDLNPGVSPTKLKVGQLINVPGRECTIL